MPKEIGRLKKVTHILTQNNPLPSLPVTLASLIQPIHVPDATWKSQTWMIELMQRLGYKESDGICEPWSGISIQTAIKQEWHKLERTMHLVHELNFLYDSQLKSFLEDKKNLSKRDAIFSLCNDLDRLSKSQYGIGLENELIANASALFFKQKMISFLEELKKLIVKWKQPIPLSILNGDHSLVIDYSLAKRCWILSDANFSRLSKAKDTDVLVNWLLGDETKLFVVRAYTQGSEIELRTETENLFASLIKISNANATGAANMSWLTLAAFYEQLSTVKSLLLQGADINHQNDMGLAAAHTAAQRNAVDILTELIKYGPDLNIKSLNGSTPLAIACLYGHEQVVELLLLHKVDVRKPAEDNQTPLFVLATKGYTKIAVRILEHDPDYPVDTARESDGITPLIAAVANGHKEMVELLLQYGAEVDKTTNKGLTPLYFAAINRNDQMVNLLLSKGADHVNS